MARRSATLMLLAGAALAAPALSSRASGELPQSGFAPTLAAIGIRDIQIQLTLHGYDAGPATGAMNEATYRAILAYQRDFGLPQDGVAGPAVENELHFMTQPMRQYAALTPPAAPPPVALMPPVIAPLAPPPQAALPPPSPPPQAVAPPVPAPLASPALPIEAGPIGDAAPADAPDAAPAADSAAAPAGTTQADAGYDEAAAFAATAPDPATPSYDEAAAFAAPAPAPAPAFATTPAYDEAVAFAPRASAPASAASYDEAVAFAPRASAPAAPVAASVSAAPAAAAASAEDPLGAAIPVGTLGAPDVALAPGDASVRAAQEYLKRLGYYDGDIDGVMDWRTVDALVKFDASGEGPKSVIAESGRVDAMWLARLKTAAAAKGVPAQP